jgi:hypothetical protein
MNDELTLDDLPQPAYEGTVGIDELSVDGDNPNEMPLELFETLKDRMLERGWIGGPILTDTDGLIADGQHRWEAAQEIGLVEVEVKQYDVDDAGRRLLRQEANKIRGEHDYEGDSDEIETILNAGYEDELSELLEPRNEHHIIDDILDNVQGSGADDWDDEFADAEFQEFDEDIADDIEYIQCPDCGHEFLE